MLKLLRKKICDVPGKCKSYSHSLHSAVLDEDYLLMGSFLDDNLKQKIGNGEYVDFAKLMPRDKLLNEEECCMELVNQGGVSFWVPVSDRENTVVSSYTKWEQAFRIFSNVYTSFHPTRAGELIQYNHVIHKASQSYSWDNVYRYDREFRMHMSRHHLDRSWAVILQQVWTMFLKDCTTPSHGSGSFGQAGHKVRCKIIFDFNSGNCSYSKRCKFKHRCSFCNKFGHEAVVCRKAKSKQAGPNYDTGGNQQAGQFDGDRWNHYKKEQVKVNNLNNNNNSANSK